MPILKKFSFDSPKLMIFCLGGCIEKAQIEMHDIVFIVAKTDEEASEKIRKKWCGTKTSLHVDSWFVAEEVDGFKVRLSSTKPLKKKPYLYFANLGYYKTGIFGEGHFMTVVVASSKTDAIKKAMSKCLHDLEMLHSDNVYDLDDCIRIEQIDHYFIELEHHGEKKEIVPINGYQKLRS